MSDWRALILSEFAPQMAELLVALDPDDLLLEERIVQHISSLGYMLVNFEDMISFRYQYESMFRSRRDLDEGGQFGAILRFRERDPNLLPFDLVQAGRVLSFSLGDLFPDLDYSVVASLHLSDLDRLYEAQVKQSPGKVGVNATKDFVLMHVFGIHTASVQTDADLLTTLFRTQYRSNYLPEMLSEHLIEILRKSERFKEWPLEQLIRSREAFIVFIQERWPRFLDHLSGARIKTAERANDAYGLKIRGPVTLPFDDSSVRVYLDTLFIDGTLRAIHYEGSESFEGSWINIGIRTDDALDRKKRFMSLLKRLESSIPPINAKYRDWLEFAYPWAELNSLRLDAEVTDSPESGYEICDLRSSVDAAFLAWTANAYASLHNQPAPSPVMVHHIPRVLARQYESRANERLALIIIDGLALDQWVVMRDVLQSTPPGFELRENAAFSWIPTITSVSRQAMLAGRAPFYFPSSIGSTDREHALWLQFWTNVGLAGHEVAYLRLDDDASELSDIAGNRSVKIVAIIVNKIDKIMHGIELGAAGMHNQVRQWARQGLLMDVLDTLLEHGFSISLTSDHGNIEAEGLGCPSEGSIAELRGQRVRIYPDRLLRSRVKEHFPGTIEWPSTGLPDDYHALIAPGRFAFIPEEHRTVAHGGISLEEVVVPLITVERKAQ